MKKQKVPKDWIAPMKNAAALLRRYGAKKVTWKHPLVNEMMMWGIRNLLFAGRPKKKGRKK